MAALNTIQQTIDYAKLATGYCANDNSKGALFGKRLTAPSSPVTQAIVTDALQWALDGGAVAATTLREMANYLWWLISPYGLTAKATITGGSGGGTVVPGTLISTSIFPLYIFGGTSGSSFESDGISYNNPNIVGVQLAIFPDQYSQQFLLAGSDTFSYTATGIVINIAGFNANVQTWVIRVEQWFGTIPTPPVTTNDLLINDTDSLLINSIDSLLIS